MNNELIERIEKRIAVLAAEVELFEGDANYTGAAIHLHTVGILQDCKAALTQQQEAEPVDWSAFPAYLIDHYEGRVLYEELLQEALSDMLRDPEYHPPKSAAPDVRCEGCGYMTHHREHMGCVRASQPQVPEWYQLVPIKPTSAMLRAGNSEQALRQKYSDPLLTKLWGAMLSAAKEEGK